MGNHYDPNETALDDKYNRGVAIKRNIGAMGEMSLAYEMECILGDLRAVEENVLGGKAIDRLRSARKRVADLCKDLPKPANA